MRGMGTAALCFACLLLATTPPVPLGAAVPQNTTIHPAGVAARRLSASDLEQISQLVAAHGQPWLAIADWPSMRMEGWVWTVQVYMYPDKPTGDVRRGKVAVLTTTLQKLDDSSARKDWKLSGSLLTYADVPLAGDRASFRIASDLDWRRPFITKPSPRYGEINDADVFAIVTMLRGGEHGTWAISEMQLIDPNFVTVERIDPAAGRSAGESVLVRRQNGPWTASQTVERQLPSGPSPGRAPSGPAKPLSALPAIVVAMLAVGLNVFGLWAVFVAWKGGRGSPQFILAMLPMAVMCLVAPIPVVVLQLIGGFSSLVVHGGSGAAMLAHINRGFLVGACGFLLSLMAAAAMQWHAGWLDAPDDDATARQPTRWATLLLQVSPAIVVPVIALVRLVERTPRTIMEQLVTATQPFGASASVNLEQLSRTIAGWLILSFVGGIVGAVVVALVGVMTFILVRSNRFAGRMTGYAWIVVVIVALLGVWNLSSVVSDLQWLTVAAAKQRM
jgi:hypothetical protein